MATEKEKKPVEELKDEALDGVAGGAVRNPKLAEIARKAGAENREKMKRGEHRIIYDEYPVE